MTKPFGGNNEKSEFGLGSKPALGFNSQPSEMF
jgi:hypothetical protein